MAAKLKLVADPTFKASVDIPVPGGSSVPVVFEFKHRTREALADFLKTVDTLTHDAAVMAVANGWDLDEPFNEKNVAALVQNYLGASNAICNAYLRELTQAKLGN